jgi:hypothetical protein
VLHQAHNQWDDSDPPDDEQGGPISDDDDDDGASATAVADNDSDPNRPVPLVDELGVDDLCDVLFAERGRIFSAAGREAPIAEFNSSGVLLRPPQLPFSDERPREEIVYRMDHRGVLLNELGEPRKIVGAKYRGNAIYTLGETKPGTVKHYAAWFDNEERAHKLYVHGEALTADMIFRIRNRTHDGEIAVFSEITTD